MKKMLALVMLLCLLVPACALAAQTITLGAGEVKTLTGTIAERVEIVLDGDATLVLDNAQIAVDSDEVALAIHYSAHTLTVKYQGDNVIESRYTGESKMESFVADVEEGLTGGTGMLIGSKTVFERVGSGTLHVQSNLFGVLQLEEGAEVNGLGFSFESTYMADGCYFGWKGQQPELDDGVVFIVSDDANKSEEEQFWTKGDPVNYRMGRTVEGVKLSFKRTAAGEVLHEETAAKGVEAELWQPAPEDEDYNDWKPEPGKVFTGWKLANLLGGMVHTMFTPEGDHTFVAHYGEMVTVTYKGTAAEPYRDPVEKGSMYFIWDYDASEMGDLADGEAFSHWQDENGKSYYAYDEIESIEEDLTLTAVYDQAVQVIYHKNPDGSGGTESRQILYGEPYMMESYASLFGEPADGRQLAYWTEKPNGQGYQYHVDEEHYLTKTLHLYPVLNDELTITYLVGGGYKKSYGTGGKAMIDGYGFKPPVGQAFSHWEDADGHVYRAGQCILNMSKSLTLKPVFMPRVTVTIDWQDGFPPLGVEVVKGSMFVVPLSDVTTRGKLTGFKVSDVDFVLAPGTEFIADRDLVLLAQFEPVDSVKLTIVDEDNGKELMHCFAERGKPYRITYSANNPVRYMTHLEDENGKKYVPGDFITMDQDTTLTAIFEDSSNGFVCFVQDTDYPDDELGSMQGTYGTWINVGSIRNCLAKRAYDPVDLKFIKYVDAGGNEHTAMAEEWLRLGIDIKEKSTIKVYWKAISPVVIPSPEDAAAAASLPETGDPSMLGAWAVLLGAAGAMGLRIRRKNG